MHQVIWRLRHTYDDCDIVLVGDSAGAQIALGYVQLMEAFPIKRIVAISPMVDMTLANPDIEDDAKHDPVLSLNAMPDLIEAIRGSHDVVHTISLNRLSHLSTVTLITKRFF